MENTDANAKILIQQWQLQEEGELTGVKNHHPPKELKKVVLFFSDLSIFKM